MFGSLILPTTTTTTTITTGTRITRSRSGGGGIQRDHLSFLPNYHPTMSNFPSRNILPRTRWRRIRASFTTTTTTTTAEAASDTNTNTNTLPSVELSSSKPNNNNLYQVLRIKQNASSLEIKTAYRKLAKQFHPDALLPTTSSSESSSDDGGARDFMAIHNAYATLSDPTERARYDLSIQIHTRRYYSSSSSTAPVDDGNEDRRRRRRRSSSYGIMQTTRRWETDQCW